jgi:hypothetical protein
MTPTNTETSTPTPTSTDLSSITTYSISGCTNLNVLVVDLGPGLIVLGDVNYYTFTGATPSGCYSVISKINAPIDDAFTTSFGTGGCNDCESTYITPTPTPTNTETPTPTTTPTPTQTPGLYTIGQAALGGIIAYIDGGGTSGTSGLVATVSDISTGAEWGCYGTSITGATGTTIGTGNANTIAIMAGCETAGIAARLCGDLVQGGYSDWYLPSKDELNALWVNRAAIGGFVNLQGYWSSTQIDSDEAWYQVFNEGTQSPAAKFGPLYVRAIRSFGT